MECRISVVAAVRAFECSPRPPTPPGWFPALREAQVGHSVGRGIWANDASMVVFIRDRHRPPPVSN